LTLAFQLPNTRFKEEFPVSNTCTKCGTTIASESTSCPACGAPVAAPVAAQPVAYTAPAAVPPPAQPVKGGSALKIILIIVAVFVLIGVLAACVVGYGVYKVAHAVHVDKNGVATIDTPNGTITSGSDASVSASDLGIDIYPGAVRGQGSMNFKTSQGSMTTAVYTTTDSVSQVVDFYKSKLGENASVMETGGGTILTSGNNNPNDSVVITVSSESGKTKVAIVHSTKKS
jgi:hypothetical protein